MTADEISDERLRHLADTSTLPDTPRIARELLRRRAMDRVSEADAALYHGLATGHWEGSLMDVCCAAREALQPQPDEAERIVDSWLDEVRAGVGTEVSDPGWKMLKARIRAALAARRD